MASELFHRARRCFIEAISNEIEQLIQQMVHDLFNHIRRSITSNVVHWSLIACIKLLLFSISNPLLNLFDMVQVNCSDTASTVQNRDDYSY